MDPTESASTLGCVRRRGTCAWSHPCFQEVPLLQLLLQVRFSKGVVEDT
jgi:hypothetical protein